MVTVPQVSDATTPKITASLRSLPIPLHVADDYPLLRVLASFRTELQLSQSIVHNTGESPIAVLNLALFRQVVEQIPDDDLLEGVASSVPHSEAGEMPNRQRRSRPLQRVRRAPADSAESLSSADEHCT